MRSELMLLTAGALVAVSACEPELINGTEEGGSLSFVAAGEQRAMSGSPAADPQQILDASFAVAQADSLEGFAAIGYQRTGSGVGNLIVLQAPRETGTFVCADDELPCDGRGATQWHGRYIEGVQSLTISEAQKFFHLVSGTLQVTQVGPDRLRATFSGVFRADDDAELVVETGSIDVPFVTADAVAELLECLTGSSDDC